MADDIVADNQQPVETESQTTEQTTQTPSTPEETTQPSQEQQEQETQETETQVETKTVEGEVGHDGEDQKVAEGEIDSLKKEFELLQNKNQELLTNLEEMQKQNSVMQKRVDDNVNYNNQVKEEIELQKELTEELGFQRRELAEKMYQLTKKKDSGDLDEESYEDSVKKLTSDMDARTEEVQNRLTASRARNKIVEAMRKADFSDEDKQDIEATIAKEPSKWLEKAIYNDVRDLSLILNEAVKPHREKRVKNQETTGAEVNQLKQQLDSLIKQLEELKNAPKQPASSKPKIDKPVIKGPASSGGSSTNQDYPLLI